MLLVKISKLYLERRDNGDSWIKIARDKGMNESSVRSIYREKDVIKSRGKKHFPFMHYLNSHFD